MRLIKAIIAGFAAMLCWELAPEGANVEPQVGTLMRVTAYCPCEKCCGKYANGYTASGHRIEEGDRFVAANASVPFGTEMIVPGYNENRPVPVLDRGGAISGDHIDVFFDTHQEALNWGIQYLKVIIVKK